MRGIRYIVAGIVALGLGVAWTQAEAQTRVMCLGNSITQGGWAHVSYRYALWFDLADSGYTVDFVGQRDGTSGTSPNLDWYPEYYTTFDRDHEGYWGWRTDAVAGIIIDATVDGQPDIVLIHLGTNDIGQMGAAGVANADTYLRLIIDRIRSVKPAVTILLAQIVPIGPGSSYYANADQVDSLNAVIDTIATTMDSPESPVVLVDQASGFDVGTMMQSDGLHPNTVGESQMASVWFAHLAPLLPLAGVDESPADSDLRVSALCNPCLGRVRLSYDVPSPGPIHLGVYDVHGVLVEGAEVRGHHVPGAYRVNLGGDLGAGVYFIRLSGPRSVRTTKVVLVK